jgi:hypothetical protein
MAFACPRCGRVSCHPEDESHGYCGACHEFTGPGITRRLIIAAGFSADAPVTALQESQIPPARLAEALAQADGGALIALPPGEDLPQLQAEDRQALPAVPALPAEPDGSAYNWHPGDPVLLNVQVSCIS